MGAEFSVFMNALATLFAENIALIAMSSLLFSIFYSMSAVLSRAMFHIFSVQYYLRLREIHESESSFLRPILMKDHRRD
jgi:hypothetical protein